MDDHYKYFYATKQDRFDHLIDIDLGFDDFLNFSKVLGKKLKLTLKDKLHPGTFRPSSEYRQFRALMDNTFDAKLYYPISPKKLRKK